MPSAGIAIRLDPVLLTRLGRSRLSWEYENLDPQSEQDLAEEVSAEDFREWPEY